MYLFICIFTYYVCSSQQQITLQVDASEIDYEIMREREDAMRQLEVCELDVRQLVRVQTHAGHSITFSSMNICTLWPSELNLWPFDLILNGLPGLMMNYPCGKFGNCRFVVSAILVVLSYWQIDTHMHTDMDECFTPATVVGFSNKNILLLKQSAHVEQK